MTKIVSVANGHFTQALRLPKGSSVNLRYAVGVGKDCPWPTLRGGVLKMAPERVSPIKIDAPGMVIGIGWALMDQPSLLFAERLNDDRVPHTTLPNIASETLYLVHTSYTHPDKIFLPQGAWTQAEMEEDDRAHVVGDWSGATLVLQEESIRPIMQVPANLHCIVVLLAQGGKIILSK